MNSIDILIEESMDFLKKKEDIAKEIYSEFSKSMLSNVYSSEKLKSDNDGYNTRIEELQNDNTSGIIRNVSEYYFLDIMIY